MKHLKIFVSEFGNSGYASAHRYNALINSFARHDESIDISVCTSFGNQTEENFAISRFWTLNINCRNGNFSFRIIKELIYAFFSVIFLLFDRRKLVLVSVPNFLSSLIILFACRQLRIPYCVDVRDLYPDVYKLAGIISGNSIIYKILLKITRYQYSKAEYLFVATKGLGAALEKMDLPKNKILCVTNGFDTEISSSIIKNSDYINRDIVFHGTLGKMQNFKFIEKIINILPDYKFTFIGSGPGFNYLKNSKLSNLLVLDRMSYENVLSIVASHKIGLCVRQGNWYDKISLPVKIFEYLGLKLKVVGFPSTEFSNDINLINKIIEIDEFDFELIGMKLKEMLTTDYTTHDGVPEYLTRSYQSDTFREKIMLLFKS